jgi:membrane protease YdiL (CAAX protease family)
MTGVTEDRKSGFGWPIFGSVALLVLCPALELITGAEWTYMLPVVVFFFLFWALTRLSRTEVGFRLGGFGSYVASTIYALLALATVAAAAMLAGEGPPGDIDAGKSLILAAQMFAATWLGTIITEDGFFRGWLWGSLSRLRLGVRGVLVWTSVVFALWHLPVAIIEENFKLPPEVIPVYIGNVFLLGVAWGIIRFASGSIVVVAYCHGVWNGIVYTFFGYGTTSGALDITDYKLYDPERGFLGLAVNALAVVLLWAWASRVTKSTR